MGKGNPRVTDSHQMTGADVALHVGARLRETREAAGLSLANVERISGGAWKAAVVASYERADRAASLARLVDLAAWYGVPFAALLPPSDAATREADALRGVIAAAARVLQVEVAARLHPPADPNHAGVPCPRPAATPEETTTP